MKPTLLVQVLSFLLLSTQEGWRPYVASGLNMLTALALFLFLLTEGAVEEP